MVPVSDETRYALLKPEDAGLAFSHENFTLPRASVQSHRESNVIRIAYRLILVISLILNLALAVALYHAKQSQPPSELRGQAFPTSDYQPSKLQTTRYAELIYNVNGTWESESPYAQENVTAADQEWMAMDTVLHRSNLEYRTRHTQTYSTDHILHCLDNLRVDIECGADDTPRFIPPDATESTVKTGVGQLRQCRDWPKLNSWAKEHGACFKYNQFLYQELSGNKVYPLAWQFCDKDSEYLPKVQKFLGKDSDWISPDPEWPDIDKISQPR